MGNNQKIDKYDFIVIGAGIVGLATALTLTQQFKNCKVLVIEKENDVAKHQTGNNSGVIHSGIYYKPGSLKAINCVEGYNLLLDFCNNNNVKYDICGKLIIATNKAEEEKLQELFNRGKENGLKGLKVLSSTEIKTYEPYAKGSMGVLVPATGIVDFKEVAEAYKTVFMNNDGKILFNNKVLNIIKNNDTVKVETDKGVYECTQVITCAGLYSDEIAMMTEKEINFRIIPFRGEYYKLSEEVSKKVKNLIYPVPDPNFPFLGVHFTRKLNGECEAGPNAVLAFKKEGYKKTDFSFKDTFNIFAWKGFRKVIKKYLVTGLAEYYRSLNKSAFTKALQKLMPEVKKSDLVVGGSGVRAQACLKSGKLLDDFYFIKSPGVLHVCNAPSPAATASLSIAKHIINNL